MVLFHKYAICLFIFGNLLFPNIAIGQTKTNSEFIKLTWENDVFLLSDREYTNGLKLDYGDRSKSFFLLRPLQSGFLRLFPDAKPIQSYTGYSLTHSMYTPVDLYAASVSFGERPYSSQILLGTNSTLFFQRSSFALELQLGRQGPGAEGKKIQEPIHRVTKSAYPQGWSNELPTKNLWGLNINYKYFWTDWIGFQSQVNLGNLDTSVSVAPIFRIGRIRSPVTHAFEQKDFTGNFQIAAGETESYIYISMGPKFQFINGTLGNPNSRFFSEPLYAETTMIKTNDGLKNYLIYETLSPKEMPSGLNFLIFNTLFNKGAKPSKSLSLYFIENLRQGRISSEEYPYIEYFLYDTVFRDGTKGVSDLSKLLALYYLIKEEPNVNKTLFLLSLYYQNEVNAKDNYSVPLKNVQGKFQMGYVYQKSGIFTAIGLEIQTLEYNAGSNILPFHRYISFQVGRSF
ncbi:MAG: DUF2219 family protein [Leptospira sp.]|nr:DUF2219 family protein [Leptospira sp.]